MPGSGNRPFQADLSLGRPPGRGAAGPVSRAHACPWRGTVHLLQIGWLGFFAQALAKTGSVIKEGER